ncbi:MAG: HAMP domain-containing protein [Deltaproteobacteria bacterium]|nr:HAMP domain-containing protein [Deltaproteobacteria bacterium]MCW5803635.1 HAMP domain-containing protein [Deltaproteobacteria bacterium]
MPARLRFRHRVGLLVVIAAAGLVTATAVTLVLGRRAERQLSGIETRYVPLVELDRDLADMYQRLTRALEDAASAADDAKLADADALVRAMHARLAEARPMIQDNGGEPDVLEAAFDDYYATARGVAAAIAGGAAAATLAPQIEQMRVRQLALAAQLAEATNPDRGALAEAFETARATQRQALVIDIAVAVGVLGLMLFASWRLISRTVRSLQAVSAGVERLASGEFATEIEVSSPDELGDLAREANRTAERLREYRAHTQALLEQTRQQADELARTSRYKSEFLANMSHELRTPLNSIMVLSKVLANNAGGELAVKHVELANTIHRCGEELLGLINEVLDLSKIEAGKQEIAVAQVATADIAAYARSMFRPLAEQKRLGFSVEVGDGVPSEIRTDWSRLAQILKNLVANAIKFTEKGAVTVTIAARGQDLAIAVSDSGIGIAREKLGWIFEAFAQAETGTSRKFGGTGLGLTIAKQLAARLGGDLTVDSELGTGSTFTLALPVAGPREESEAPAPPVAHAATPAISSAAIPLPMPPERTPAEPLPDGVSVLLVEDDMRTMYSLASSLRGRKVTVHLATDADEALRELERTGGVDAILLGGGAGAAERLRADARWQRLPIVTLGEPGDVPKPVDVERLLAVVRERLAHRADQADAGTGTVKQNVVPGSAASATQI